MIPLSSFVFFALILLPGTCVCQLQRLWHDTMDDYTAHWASAGAGISASNDMTNCASSACVEIKGFVNSEDWLIRTTGLPLIPNLHRFSSFLLQFDVTLANIESANACLVQYKYDTDATYTTLASLSSPDRKLRNETRSISLNGHNLNHSQVLYIKLETDGDSSSGNDYCYFDNVYLFGHVLENNIILRDTLDAASTTASSWVVSNTQSVAFLDSSAYCSSGGCAEIRGYIGLENAMSRAIAGIAEYFDIFVEFDVHLVDMEEENACQVLYRYAGDEFRLLWSMAGGNGDVSSMKNVVSIPLNPQHAKDANVLHLKLNNNGDSSSGGDYCYFDDIAVKGTLLNDTNRAQHLIDVYAQNNAHKAHVIIIGDIGGQDSAPYYTSHQVTTAAMLSTIAALYNISGFIALGDNIYNSGVRDEFDPRFVYTFENIYYHTNILHLPWFFTTGNHDYGLNITGQVEYSKHSERWNFPSLYYTKSWYFGEQGDIELLFVALDTYILCGTVTSSGNYDCDPPDTAKANIHWQWLRDTLSASNATFKLVGGHTPIYSYAHHGPTAQLIDELNPLLLEHNVNAYIFGHDHVVQFIEDNTTHTENLHHIGSGAGHDCRDSFIYINGELNPSDEALKYMDCDQGGFVRLTIDTQQVTMQAFYYLSRSAQVQFFSGRWDRFGEYTTINEILLYPPTTPAPTTPSPTTPSPTTPAPTTPAPTTPSPTTPAPTTPSPTTPSPTTPAPTTPVPTTPSPTRATTTLAPTSPSPTTPSPTTPAPTAPTLNPTMNPTTRYPTLASKTPPSSTPAQIHIWDSSVSGLNGQYNYYAEVNGASAYKKDAPDAGTCDPAAVFLCKTTSTLPFGGPWRITNSPTCSGSYLAWCTQTNVEDCDVNEWDSWSASGSLQVDTHMYYAQDASPRWNCSSIQLYGLPMLITQAIGAVFDTQIGRNAWRNSQGYVWAFNPFLYEWRLLDGNTRDYRDCSVTDYLARTNHDEWRIYDTNAHSSTSSSTVAMSFAYPDGTVSSTDYLVQCNGVSSWIDGVNTEAPTSTAAPTIPAPTTAAPTTPAPTRMSSAQNDSDDDGHDNATTTETIIVDGNDTNGDGDGGIDSADGDGNESRADAIRNFMVRLGWIWWAILFGLATLVLCCILVCCICLCCKRKKQYEQMDDAQNDPYATTYNPNYAL